MRAVRHNFIANSVGNAWLSVANIAVVPLYIHALGIEAYGLIGFYGMLQAVLSSLDFGMNGTLTREASRALHGGDASGLAGLFVAVERLFLGIALMSTVGLGAFAPWLGTHWVHVEGISRHTATLCIATMAICIGGRFLVTLYCAALTGLQDHVLLNTLKVLFESIRLFGSLLALFLVPGSLAAFFLFQAITLVVYAVVMRVVLCRNLPLSTAAANFKYLRSIWQFAAGMYGISLTTVVLMQIDRFFVSRVLSLKELGYYSVACTLAFGVYKVINPISTAVYPRLATLVQSGVVGELNRVFHAGAQLVAVTAVPISALLAIYADGILLLWTRNAEVAAAATRPLELLAIGMCFNALVNMPYAVQLAFGWTSLTLGSNLVSIALLIPVLMFSVARYGITGAAIAWPAVNFVYVCVVPNVLFRRHLSSEKAKWYLRDCVVPLCSVFGIGLLCRAVLPRALDTWQSGAAMGTALMLMVAVGVLTCPNVRQEVVSMVRGGVSYIWGQKAV